MGNWFGSPEVQKQPAPTFNYESRTITSGFWQTYERPRSSQQPSSQINYQRRQNPPTFPTYSGANNINSNYRNPTVQIGHTNTTSKNSKLCSVKSVVKRDISFILEYIDNYAQDLNWDFRNYSEQPVHFIELEVYSSEYQTVQQLFRSTNKKCFVITKIERIQNPFLLAAFLLKQEEMEMRFGEQDVEEFFHGTLRENVMKICTNNFDYRLYGLNKGSKFGQGVSFTPISNYATHYGNKECDNRVMLLARVLVGEECIGKSDMILPYRGTNTSIKEDGHVVVKYEDNEFYPAYKITYTCTYPAELQRRTMNNHVYRVRKQRHN